MDLLLNPSAHLHRCVTWADEAAIDAAQRLSIGEAAGTPTDVGFSGAAALAGLLQVMNRHHLREQLKLGVDSHVLVFGTEAGERSA